jgi:hypothetical protein
METLILKTYMTGATVMSASVDIMCMDGNQHKDLHLDLKTHMMQLCLN